MFLKWIFQEVKKSLTKKKHDEGYETWTDMPFLSKYLGDGILFLWDVENLEETRIQNIVVGMSLICRNYIKNFLPQISNSIVVPPIKLRCGIARGNIYSVGNGNDFVGPCINMSSRLQKFSNLSFCFSRRGINLDTMREAFKKNFIVKKINIRGIGDDELICIYQNEFDELSDIDKAKFIDV